MPPAIKRDDGSGDAARAVANQKRRQSANVIDVPQLVLGRSSGLRGQESVEVSNPVSGPGANCPRGDRVGANPSGLSSVVMQAALDCLAGAIEAKPDFSALTKGDLDPRTISSGDPDIVSPVERGISARGLPACGSCHGAHVGGPIETPTLAGQRQDYLLVQLNAFAKGDRHNDIFNRMRGIAAKLREDEIEKLAEYYAAVRLFRAKD
jgi:cytochrome c553